MEIDEYRVRGAGGKVRRVGDDAQQYLEQAVPKLSSGLQCNNCLSSVSTLRQVVQHLETRARGLAATSQTLGDNLVQAAANHGTNDVQQGRNITAFSPEISRVGGN
ncbi:hypothetical protein [Stackebrandtia soli]|uniref:hypothetical protein n=1 Tax=Stackebrandtia soli TaxID=1892856 RepID=UPI0039EB672F